MNDENLEDINEENYEEGVQNKITEYLEDLFCAVGQMAKYTDDDMVEPPDKYVFNILESSFIILFHERNLPLELLHVLFKESPEYFARIHSVITGSILEESEISGEVVAIRDDDGKYKGHMLKSKYDEITGLKDD